MNPRLLRPTKAKAVAPPPPPPPGPITLWFYDSAANGDWADGANWWADAGTSMPAEALPDAGTNVVVAGNVTGNTGDPAVCLNATVSGAIGIAVVVYGVATFVGTAELYGTINGAAVFTEFSRMNGDATVSATFTDDACYASGTSDLFIPGSPPQCV